MTRDEVIEAMARALYGEKLVNWGHNSESTKARFRIAATAALTAAEPFLARAPVEEWLPIETAPKDGTPIRLFDPEYCDDEMNPSLEGHRSDGAHDGAGGFQAAVWNNSQDYFATVDVKPTHWRPLPPAPAGDNGGEVAPNASGMDTGEMHGNPWNIIR